MLCVIPSESQQATLRVTGEIFTAFLDCPYKAYMLLKGQLDQQKGPSSPCEDMALDDVSYRRAALDHYRQLPACRKRDIPGRLANIGSATYNTSTSTTKRLLKTRAPSSLNLSMFPLQEGEQTYCMSPSCRYRPSRYQSTTSYCLPLRELSSARTATQLPPSDASFTARPSERREFNFTSSVETYGARWWTSRQFSMTRPNPVSC